MNRQERNLDAWANCYGRMFQRILCESRNVNEIVNEEMPATIVECCEMLEALPHGYVNELMRNAIHEVPDANNAEQDLLYDILYCALRKSFETADFKNAVEANHVHRV